MRTVSTTAENSIPSSEPAQPVQHVSSAHVAILAAIRAFAVILSARLLLFLALAGAFVLAVMSERDGSILNLLTLVAYCCLTVIPLVWVDCTARRGP